MVGNTPQKGEKDMVELRNEKTVNLKLRRIDVCDLLIACNAAQDESGAEKWKKLHDKLREMLEAWDEDYDAKHKHEY